MTLDQAVALSLSPGLGRVGLTERLRAGDPQLLEVARAHLDAAAAEQRRAVQLGIGVLAWSHPRFPAALLAIGDVPPVLWYQGQLDALDAPVVAIVGARAASHVALEMADRLAADLAAAGVTVVSGLARGVDSAAHRGALRSGRTIAVLGSGLNRIYPAEHTGLAREIATRGLVVSEHPPDMPPLPFHFPLRNRLISGVARAVVVIEASEKSGSLITAACALEQGRDVLAVPGNALSGRNRGGHGLIRDGAKIVEGADDILTELGLAPGPARAVAQERRLGGPDAWVPAMETGHAYDLDGLVSLSGLDGVRLLPRLLELELSGVVKRVEGGRFVRPS
jgi:DNA processing protein